MNITCCIMLCLAAFTLVECNGEDQFVDAGESIVDKPGNSQFSNLLVDNDKIYLISSIAYQNVSEAMNYCNIFGGYLTEIDDVKEYKALRIFVLKSSVIKHLLIAGSDAENEGTWIFQRTGQPVKILDWARGQPDNQNGIEDCLDFWKNAGAKMNDQTCGFQNPDNRFMCEIPNNSLVYNNKLYLISTIAHKNVEEAMTFCTAFGGYLAEIDDVNEYKALQKFVLNSSVKNLVIIAGSDADKEGTWKFQRTGQPVDVFDWVQGQPDNFKGDEDCLSLWKPNGGKMKDETCGLLSPDNRFMCEIPSDS